jgi:hypothetical protein
VAGVPPPERKCEGHIADAKSLTRNTYRHFQINGEFLGLVVKIAMRMGMGADRN